MYHVVAPFWCHRPVRYTDAKMWVLEGLVVLSSKAEVIFQYQYATSGWLEKGKRKRRDEDGDMF